MMNRKHILDSAGILLVAVCLSLCFTQPTYAKPGYIQVTVRRDHKPVVGAYIQVYSSRTESLVGEGYTDEKGKITFSEAWVEPNVEYSIYVNYPSLSASWNGAFASTNRQASLNLRIDI